MNMNYIWFFILTFDWRCLSAFVDIFDDTSGCFEGVLELNEVEPGSHTIHIKRMKNTKELIKSEFLINDSDDPSLSDGRPKESPVSFINRLAAFNKIPVEYHIVKEEGPDHDKMFTISLKLGGETYMGEGKSLKSAKQIAASQAIEETSYSIPPVKEKKKYVKQNFSLSDVDTDLDPISLVYELSKKLDLSVNFELIDEEGPSHEKIFVMRCLVGDIIKTGEGSTKKKAKKAAAIKVLEDLQKLFQSNDENISDDRYDIPKLNKKKRRKNRKNKNKSKRLLKAIKNKSTWKDALSLIWQSVKDWDTSLSTEDYKQKNLAKKQDWFKDYQKKHVVQEKGFVKKSHSQPSDQLSEVQEFDTVKEDNKHDMYSEAHEDTLDDEEELKGNLDHGGLILPDHDTAKEHNEIHPHLFGTKEFHVIKIANVNKLSAGTETAKDILAQIFLNVNYKLQFYEFLKTNSTETVSVVQLPFKPPIICYGIGITTSDAQNKAAKSSLDTIKLQSGSDKMKDEL